MTKTAKNNFKFEITKNDDGDYDYLGSGGDVLDYLATLSETFVQLCKDNQLPPYPLINGMFKEELSENVPDKLEEYLVAYDEESIQKIRDKKIQLVTANEFFGLHQEKLAAERKAEELQKRCCDRYEKLLTENKGIRCPLCNFEMDSWNDFVAINNILECPECEEHFKLFGLPLAVTGDI